MKGLIYLLQAFKLLKPGLDIRLLLVGRGLETPAFKNMADATMYKNQIFFTGFRTDALALDKASDVFVMPSIYGESITKAVIEAMSVGTAPLITSIPGNKHLAEHAVSGVVVPPKNPQAIADGIMGLYEKREWCAEMGENAKKRIKARLNTELTVKEYAAFYADLASGENTYRTKPDVL